MIASCYYWLIDTMMLVETTMTTYCSTEEPSNTNGTAVYRIDNDEMHRSCNIMRRLARRSPSGRASLYTTTPLTTTRGKYINQVTTNKLSSLACPAKFVVRCPSCCCCLRMTLKEMGQWCDTMTGIEGSSGVSVSSVHRCLLFHYLEIPHSFIIIILIMLELLVHLPAPAHRTWICLHK